MCRGTNSLLWPPLVSLLLFFPSSISDVAAQNLPTETPSVESGPSRRQRADALIAEAENYLFIDNNPSKAYDVALEANLLSQVANYRSGQMRSLLVAGLAKLSLKEGGTAAFLLRAAELIAQDMGNSFLQLEATLATAHMYDFQSKFDELKKVQDRLMFLLLDLGFSPGQAEVYANRGNLDLVRTDQRKSELAARLEAALGQGNLGVATGILRRLAFMHSQKGEFKEALGRLEDWLKLLEPKDTYNRSLALADVGRLERLLGRPEAALQHSDEAVLLFRRLKDRIGEAYGLIGMAEANRDLLKFEDALDAYGKAADIYRLLGFQRQAALSYSGAGDIAGMLGNPDKELELKKMGLGLIRKANDLIREAYYLCSLGWAYGKQKDILKASESFNAALEMARDRDDRQLEMQALWGIGAIHGYLKQHQQAKQPLLKALSLARELKNAQVEGAILHNLSTISLRSKEVAEARTFATQELQVGEATKDFSRIGYARYQLAAILLEEGKPAEAIPLLKEVVSIIENVRGRLVSEEARLGFLEGKDVAYYDLIRALILLHGQGDIKGYDREAFEYTERARTRTLLEFVSALREKQGSASGLVRREITLRYRIASLNTQLTTNDFKPQSERLNPSYLQAEREAAYREYTEVLAEMKRTTGGGFPSSTADPISLKEIQSLLTDGAVLIEYVVTRTQLIIWVVSADGLHPILVPVDQEDLNSRISSFRNKLERHSSDFEKDAKDLYRFLITPIQPFLSGAKRLVISPHGELHHVAFGALINPQTNQFLVAGASLSFIPSASLLKWVQKHPGPSGYKVLALGIGTFDKLPQLAQAETEAVTVGNAFNDRLILVGSEATIGRFKEEASHYDIIHIASHAEIDSDAPLLSRIILKDGLGRDTSLYTSDVFELTLRASLVTLSACETSLGKIGAGNEVLGFVRGFLFAGVSSVVASQWRVDDIATSELMIEMYTSIKDGRPKDEALQAAQKRLLASKMHSHPYYWAGFFLTGDRR